MIIDIIEGRRHAVGILIGAAQSFTRDGILSETIERVRKSAESMQNIDYRRGMLEIVEAVEGALNEMA